MLLMTASYVHGQAPSNSDLRERDFGAHTTSRLLQKDKTDNGGGDGGLVEKIDCQASSRIRQDTIDHERTDAECKANNCGGGCCRVFTWLVCDTSNEFSHLACICNDNTMSHAPTVRPTPRPTMAPTISARPTVTHSTSPTKNPTGTPSAMPSTTPTVSPSVTPSQSPTRTPFTTTRVDENGVWVSTCTATVPQPSFLQDESFSYSYEVYYDASIDIDPATTVTKYLNDQIHDSLAKTFLKCQFDDAIDDIQEIMSQDHVIDGNKECLGRALNSGEQCFVVNASETVIVYKVPSRRKLQDVDLIGIMATFLFNTLNSAMYRPGLSGINAIEFINDGSNSITISPPTPAPTLVPSSAGGDKNGLGGNEVRSTGGGGGGISTAGVAIVSVICGALFVVFLMAVVNRRNKQKEILEDYDDDTNLDMAHEVTALELHVDLDSLPEEIPMDPYTSPTSRSPSAPLTSQDALDRVVGDHRGFRHSPRRYKSSDTIDL
jgi:hypothetical protein